MDTKLKKSYKIWSIIRLIAREISIAYIGFFVFMIMLGAAEKEDLGLYILFGLYICGLLVAWKWELTGAMLSLATMVGLGIINSEFRTNPIEIIFLASPATIFLLCGWNSRKVPIAERKSAHLLHIIKTQPTLRKFALILAGFITLVIICTILSNEDFLPFLKYRAIKDIDKHTGYRLDIERTANGLFALYCRTSPNFTRLYITWFGDTTKGIFSGNGFLQTDGINFKIIDSAIASVSKGIITPQKIGKTRLLFPFESRVDTIPIEVFKKPNGLAVSWIYKYETILEKNPNAQLVTHPFIIRRPTIIFPDTLWRGQRQVEVLVEITIDTTGKPLFTKVLRSEDDRFNKLAEAYGDEFRFEVDHSSDRSYRFQLLPIVFKKNRTHVIKNRGPR